MANAYERQEILTTFQRNNKPLFDKVEDVETLIVPMKIWCDEFLEKVRKYFRRPTVQKYEREVEKMMHMIEEIEQSIQSKLTLIKNDAVLADETYDFFDPDTIDVWMEIERDLANYKDEMWCCLNAFFDFQIKFVEFKKRVEGECRRRNSDF